MKQINPHPLSLLAARLVLAMAAVGYSAGAAAVGAGVMVNDPESILKQIAEFAEQAKRWADTVRQYRQMISTIAGLNFQSLMPTKPLQQMDVQTMVKQACPGSGNVIGDIFSAAIDVSLSGSIVENSQRLCVMVTTLKVKMYNETVVQSERMPMYDNQIAKLSDLLNKLLGSSSSVGDTQTLILDTTKLSQQFAQEMQAYETNMKAYQLMLSTLKDQQSLLAQISLKGKPSPLGRITQAAVFAAAFR